MEKFTIEQKAKLYDEVVERAKEIINNQNASSVWKGWLCNCFPELTESKDERIRRVIRGWIYTRPASFFDNGISKEEMLAWLEKQQKPIINVPPREVIISIWDLGNEWKELTNGSISTEHGTQLDYIQKHWHESEYYLQKKQGEQKLTNSYCQEHCKGFQETGKCFADGDCKAKTIAETVDKVEPKFKVGDKIRKKTPSSFDTDMEVARIDKDYYICNHIGKFSSEVVPFSKESSYELVEQKSTDKDEPKFHEGDWIVWQDKYYKVNYNGCGYELFGQNGLSTSWGYKDVEDNAHLWTIQDAKPGDVLASKDELSILIFRNLDTSTSFSSYYNIQGKGELGWSNECFIPATKEQRDTLMKAMADAGYSFGFNKKELKKIKKDDCGPDALIEESYRQQADDLIDIVTEKSAWSEEDESMVLGIEQVMQCASLLNIVPDKIEKVRDWLKSLKERVQLQPKQEWSEEDEHRAKDTIYFLDTAKKHYAHTVFL